MSSIEIVQSLLALFMHLTFALITFNAPVVRPGHLSKSEIQFDKLLLESRLNNFEINLYALPLIWYNNSANDFNSSVYLFPLFFSNVNLFEHQWISPFFLATLFVVHLVLLSCWRFVVVVDSFSLYWVLVLTVFFFWINWALLLCMGWHIFKIVIWIYVTLC